MMRWTPWMVLVSVVLWAGGAQLVYGDPPEWTPIGPYGGAISALAVDPTRPTTLYAGTDTGVYQSRDGGGTWRATGLTNLAIHVLAVQPSILYAGTDGGVFALPLAVSCLGTGPSHLWGRITGAPGGGGLPGVTLTLEGPNACTTLATTGAWGFYGFSTLGDGAYTLTPHQAGCTFDPPSQDVTIMHNTPRVSFRATCP
jgi:hypothetical protein